MASSGLNSLMRIGGSIIKDIERSNRNFMRELERERKLEIKRENERKRQQLKIQKMNEKQEGLVSAQTQTEKAQRIQFEIQNLLKKYNGYGVILNWDEFIIKDNFTEKPPKPEYPEIWKKIPEKPKENDYIVRKSILTTLFPKLKIRKEKKAKVKFKNHTEEWEKKKKKIEAFNNRVEESDKNKLNRWEQRKITFETEKEKNNTQIENAKYNYSKGISDGVCFFAEKLIENLKLPLKFKIENKLYFDDESRILVLDIGLPVKEIIPKLKSVKYYVTKMEFAETFINDKEISNLYDLLIIQYCLYIQNALYSADIADILESIVFNGWVTAIDESTGKNKTACIISMQSKKSEFKEIDLKNVEPKACFKRFKGISGNKLSELVPIVPILQINKSDKRFVESINVAHKITGQNLALMDWEEFEHLIRELFDKEFSINGGEVKVTQASRDGGVDAIAFDPDPIRGGKIVIQAKRYTNVVGVAAVRDLYGTLINEGAIKGILVTTSNYGADAHNFAKDKPLTLLNGSNLLHLLEKHGFSGRIDISEAKAELKKNNNK